MPSYSFQPLEPAALQNLNNAAESVLMSLRKLLGEEASYGPRAVKALSDDLDRNRANYIANETVGQKILWLYGAFLGRSIVECNADSGWVENCCVKLTTSKGEILMAEPLTRVGKHLHKGPEYSILTYFLGIEDTVRNK